MDKTLILVVEDDIQVQKLITVTLKAEGYRFLTAQTGQAAVITVATHNPDIILLDLGLPDIDGVEVIRRIRSWSNVPIIVISARSDDPDKIDALDAGADDYLTKPFSVAELLARLRVTLRRINSSGSSTEPSLLTMLPGVPVSTEKRFVSLPLSINCFACFPGMSGKY